MQQPASFRPASPATDAPTTVLGGTSAVPYAGTPAGATVGSGASGAAPAEGMPAAGAPGTGEREMIVLRVRRHGRRLTLPILVLIASAGAAGYWVGSFPEFWQNLAAGAGITAVALLLGLGPILGWASRRTLITTRRVISYRGTFSRTRSEMPLARVREVQSKQHPVQRMWGSGDLLLFVGTETRKVHDAPGIFELQEAVQVLAEQQYIAAASSTGAQTGSFFG